MADGEPVASNPLVNNTTTACYLDNVGHRPSPGPASRNLARSHTAVADNHTVPPSRLCGIPYRAPVGEGSSNVFRVTQPTALGRRFKSVSCPQLHVGATSRPYINAAEESDPNPAAPPGLNPCSSWPKLSGAKMMVGRRKPTQFNDIHPA